MLCDLAKTFPNYVAALLERDSSLTRNFREETVTDLLMASLIGLQSLGIRVDFPDEATTGGDMEWVFAAPLEVKGGRYLKLILQAKRAQLAKLKKGKDYWYYQHLDHAGGQQANTLMGQATRGTLPLYIFYHPTSALRPARPTKQLPSVEGVNIVFASAVAPVIASGCGRADKKVSRWRPKFLPLTDLLCWRLVSRPVPPPGAAVAAFLQGIVPPLFVTGTFHPDIVASRLTDSAIRTGADVGPISAADEIPDDVGRAIRGETTKEDRKKLVRPRLIFSTSMKRDDSTYRDTEITRGRPV